MYNRFLGIFHLFPLYYYTMQVFFTASLDNREVPTISAQALSLKLLREIQSIKLSEENYAGGNIF